MGQRLACFQGLGAPAKSAATEPGEETPLKNEKTSLSRQASRIAMDQVHEIEEEGYQEYLGSFLPCRLVAPVDFPCLEEHRVEVLWLSQILCVVAVILSFLAFWGGFSHTGTLRSLPWVHVTSGLGQSYAGVKWVCWDLPYPPQHGTFGDDTGVVLAGNGQYFECQTWADHDCSASPAARECRICKMHAVGLTFSVFMAVFSFVGLFNSTSKRLDGKDSNFVKFMAVVSCLIGGVNFLGSACSYWYTCVLSVHVMGAKVETGIALWFMLVAAAFKVGMGFVHLGLSVEHDIDEKGDKKV
jgi:hypothetical protein